MVNAPHPFPKLRPIESVFISDPTHGRALLLRDTEGIAPGAVVIPGPLAPVVSCFNGARSIAQIATDASRAAGRYIDESLVAALAAELDTACMLDTPWFQQRRREIIGSFAAAAVRPAAHAGGAYHADPAKLCRYIDDECLARAPARRARGMLVGLCAPHMDLWRAAVGYGHAYRALREALDPQADTFILLGTSHAAMRRPFSVCDKVFATPLGMLDPDHDAIRELAAASHFDVHDDEYLHKNEHSLEFQVVFLRHLLGERPATIVPILCGIGDAHVRGRDPSQDANAESFIGALRGLVERREGRVMIIAGADLAHIGPRFGDHRPLDACGKEFLAQRDRQSIDLALARDARGFFAHVVEDFGTRRVCGIGPIYTMLRALPESRGEQLHYAQCVDPEEGSIVSHASLGFYADL
jgi:AmmeMemoRadiSam system protein B